MDGRRYDILYSSRNLAGLLKVLRRFRSLIRPFALRSLERAGGPGRRGMSSSYASSGALALPNGMSQKALSRHCYILVLITLFTKQVQKTVQFWLLTFWLLLQPTCLLLTCPSSSLLYAVSQICILHVISCQKVCYSINVLSVV